MNSPKKSPTSLSSRTIEKIGLGPVKSIFNIGAYKIGIVANIILLLIFLPWAIYFINKKKYNLWSIIIISVAVLGILSLLASYYRMCKEKKHLARMFRRVKRELSKIPSITPSKSPSKSPSPPKSPSSPKSPIPSKSPVPLSTK